MKKITTLQLRSFFTTAAFLFCLFTNAQNNVGIGATPNASAKLDVSSTTQGMLVPRMNSSQRGLIASPATGLMVYQTDGVTGFYYYDGTAWTIVGAPNPNSYPNAVLGHNINSTSLAFYHSLYTTINSSSNSGSGIGTSMYFPTSTTITVTIYSLLNASCTIGLYNLSPASGVTVFSDISTIVTTTIPASTGGVFQTGTFSATIPAGAFITLKTNAGPGGTFFTRVSTQ